MSQISKFIHQCQTAWTTHMHKYFRLYHRVQPYHISLCISHQWMVWRVGLRWLGGCWCIHMCVCVSVGVEQTDRWHQLESGDDRVCEASNPSSSIHLKFSEIWRWYSVCDHNEIYHSLSTFCPSSSSFSSTISSSHIDMAKGTLQDAVLNISEYYSPVPTLHKRESMHLMKKSTFPFSISMISLTASSIITSKTLCILSQMEGRYKYQISNIKGPILNLRSQG